MARSDGEVGEQVVEDQLLRGWWTADDPDGWAVVEDWADEHLTAAAHSAPGTIPELRAGEPRPRSPA